MAASQAIKVVRNQSFSNFTIRSDFSFAMIDKINVMSIFFFFLIGLKSQGTKVFLVLPSDQIFPFKYLFSFYLSIASHQNKINVTSIY